MRIQFHADGQFVSPDLREHAETTIRSAFQRFEHRVRQVTVYLWDVNGPRGGIDKGVRLSIELVPSGVVLVRHIEANELASMSGAVARARHAVSKRLRRNWDRRRRSAQRAASHSDFENVVASPVTAL